MTPPGFRRHVLGAALGALGLVALGSTASRADSPPCGGSATVSVEVGGSIHSVISAQLCAAADVFDTTYQTRGIPGAANTQDTPQIQQGTSIRALLASIGVDPDAVQFVDLPRADGTWTTLSAADLADPSDFAAGLEPVFAVDGNQVDYYRPLYPDPHDTNAADHVQSPEGGVLSVGVHAGPLLSVTAAASTSTVTTGTPVTFTASATGGSAGSAPYTFEWNFGDGRTGTGRSVKHVFKSPGSFDAQVTASGADSAGGVSPQVQVTVGTPPKSGHGPGKGSSHNPHHPATGPTHGHGHSTAGRPSHRGDADVAATTSTGMGTVPLPPVPAGGGNRHLLKTRPSHHVVPEVATPPPTVTGRLVTAGITLTAAQTTTAARATSPAARAGGSIATIASATATASGVVLLVALGMVRELRGTRRSSATDS